MPTYLPVTCTNTTRCPPTYLSHPPIQPGAHLPTCHIHQYNQVPTYLPVTSTNTTRCPPTYLSHPPIHPGPSRCPPTYLSHPQIHPGPTYLPVTSTNTPRSQVPTYLPVTSTNTTRCPPTYLSHPATSHSPKCFLLRSKFFLDIASMYGLRRSSSAASSIKACTHQTPHRYQPSTI